MRKFLIGMFGAVALVTSAVAQNGQQVYACKVMDSQGNEQYICYVAQSYDPNEMSGPAGIGAQRFVKSGEPMDYTIYFENQTNATAAAIKIAVTLPKDANLDWSTLELGEVVFGDHTDDGFVKDKSARSSVFPLVGTGCEVRTTVTEDDDSVTWNLRIWDPTTSDHFPDDLKMGILPPNDPETHCGEGHITYRVKVKDGAAPGSVINASASIVFDDNPAIETDPAWWNTVAQVQTVEVHDGEGAVVTQDLIVGVPYGENLPPDPAGMPGHTFGGWWTGPNGTGRRVTADTIVQADDAALYAYWTEDAPVATTYTVCFHANGGDGEMTPQTNTYDTVSCLTSNAFTYAHHVFCGWATNETGEVVFGDGAAVSNLTTVANGVVDLFAVWELITMEVSFDLNYADATERVPPMVVTNGVAYGTLPEVGRVGYTFDGWMNGLAARSTWVTADTIVTNEANHTLYARWTAIDESVEQTITIPRAGWNLVSFNVLPDDPSPEAVFADVADSVQSVISGTRRWTPQSGGRLAALQIGVGYWVKTTRDNVEWTISGKPNEAVVINVNEGWNLIGYPLLEAGAPETVLRSASNAGIVSSVISGTRRWTPQSGGRLTELTPGVGYWLKAIKAGAIKFDR